MQFVANGQRRTIRLGKMSAKLADSFKGHIEGLLAAIAINATPDLETLKWANGLDQAMAERLAGFGLIPKREHLTATTLGQHLAQWLASRPAGTKESTRTVYGHTIRCLKAFFNETKSISEITNTDAVAWSNWLRHDEGEALAENTARRRCGYARQIFKEAFQDGLISRNPFSDSRIRTAVGGSGADRNRYVTVEEFATILEWCPNDEWRAIVTLARVAGVRVPSEIEPLTWADVAWDRGRMFVRSPKTEHHDGQDAREVPLFPEVRTELDRLWHALPELTPAEAPIFGRVRFDKNLRTQFEKIVRRAGVRKLPKPFVNLRASAACDLVDRFGIRAAKEWLGHSAAVMLKHYDRGASDQTFERAAGITFFSKAQQNAQQQAAILPRNASQVHSAENKKARNFRSLPDNARTCEISEWSLLDPNQ